MLFLKSFKLKATNQLKTSEGKALKHEFQRTFPLLTDQELETIFPKREIISSMKIITSNQSAVTLYVVQKRAVGFIYEGVIFPTIYLLWKFPELIVSFTTHEPVLKKLAAGADLMLPGVVNNFGNFAEGTPAYVNLASNKAAVAVGITARSSNEMARSNGKGKCVIVYHVWNDKICALDNLPVLPVVELGPPNCVLQDKEEAIESALEALNDCDIVSSVTGEEQEDDPEAEKKSMDQLLTDCFLSAIKYSKTLTLPMLTSTFYKTQMLPVHCDKEEALDVKKSSYKKLSKFLNHMMELGIVQVREEQKGVESIHHVNRQHEMVTHFKKKFNVPKDSSDKVNAPQIVEAYSINAAVLPIFSQFGFKKSDSIQASQVRKYLVEYINLHNYVNESDKKLVNVQDVLARVLKTEGPTTWEQVMNKMFSTMGRCYKITRDGAELSARGQIEPIVINVATRSSNKKVTLVDNLELYGINIANFAKECQLGVAASTTTNPGKKSSQLMIQGNQVLFLNNLLTEKYHIPKNYIKGLENAPKKKK